MRFRRKHNHYEMQAAGLARSLLALFAVLCLASCKKGELPPSYSYVYVQSGEGESYAMDGVEGQWDLNTHTGHLSGEGVAYEHLQLFLPDLHDTGIYPEASIRNIRYSDGAEFDANAFEYGTIHIRSINSTCVTGDFRVSLTDTRNGGETRRITGTFGINGQ